LVVPVLVQRQQDAATGPEDWMSSSTEEELNGPEIGTGFEEMHSKCVPKRMRRDGFYETGETMRLLAGCFNGVLRDRPIAATAR